MGSARPNRRRRSSSVSVFSRALALLGLLAFACDFPEPEACALACGPAGECPSAFECQPETLLCAPRGSELCTSSVVLPSGGGEPRADAGQRPPDEPGTDEPVDAGEAPGPDEPPPSAIQIELSAAAPACTGAELELELSASGGAEPYAWRLLKAPPGLRLSAARGRAVTLVGVPETAGLVLAEVVDATGRRAVSEGVAIHERPSIETFSLPAVCAGAGYSVQLDAWGGDVDARVWSARLVTSETSAPLDALGLGLDGSTLSSASVPEGLVPGTVRLELGLSDGWCEAEGVELELEVSTRDTDVCPSISIVGEPSERLPPPCRGNRYTESLHVEGGVPPFTWTEIASPPGLYFDVDSGVVEGIPREDGELAVAVTDGEGRTVEASYEVSVRDRCWLAYVAGGVSPARLALVDPRLLERQPDNARRLFPDRATVAAVQDYRFSPDGRFIAYRSGPGADALGIELVRVVDGATAPVVLPEPAGEYAWSLDSAILFVATGAAPRMLHAVDLSGLDADDDEGLDLRLLEARAIPTPSGPFAAFGSRELAFSTPDADVPPRARLVTIRVQRAAMAPPITRTELDFSASVRVTGTPSGAVVTDPETGVAVFFPGDGRPPAAHADAIATASGALAVRAAAGKLAIFDAANPVTPLFDEAGCSRLLARATDTDRFACASDGPALELFELGPDGLVGLTTPGQLPLGDPLGARRVFSAGGRWFAGPDGDGLSVWSLEPGAPRRTTRLPSATLGAPPSTLSFSPDEGRLVIGGGNRLVLLDLASASAAASLLELSSSALLDDTCSERSSDGLEQWCGSDSGLSALRWSASSDALAFRSSLGTLSVIDVSASGDGRIGRALAPDVDCDEACASASSARFQP